MDNQLFNKCRRYAKDYCHVQGRWHEQTPKSTPSGWQVMSCLYRQIKEHRKEVWLRGTIFLCKMFGLFNGTYIEFTWVYCLSMLLLCMLLVFTCNKGIKYYRSFLPYYLVFYVFNNFLNPFFLNRIFLWELISVVNIYTNQK